VKTVVREFKWEPSVIDDMFIDDADYKGIKYWYDDIIDVHKQLKKA
tara:strand:+ start:10850 stop:10987 length:138 start_codon:yes stop_codon:yes gene_type:complete